MDGLGLLAGIAALVLALVALKRSSRLVAAIAELKLQLASVTDEVMRQRVAAGQMDAAPKASEVPQAAPPPDPVPAAASEAGVVTAKPASNWISSEPVPVETSARETPPESPPPGTRPSAPPHDMEQALASRWFVWIGGIAIAVGGLLFVKYAYDNGLFPPALQIVFGLAAAAALVAAGEFLRRKSSGVEGPDYVPAALSAAGLVTAFGSIYAAYALYELITPTPAFIGLAAVALAAFALSRLQGPLIAALGLLGSYGTPMLIPSEHPSAWSFFPYLLVINAASFAVLRGRNWWWLGYAAIAGSTAWSLLWLVGRPFGPAEMWPIGLFAHAIGIVSFFGLTGLANLKDESGFHRSAPLTQALLIGLWGLAAGIIVLAVLVSESNHATLALLLFMIAMAGLLAIGWKKPALDLLAPASAILTLAILAAWNDVAFHELAMDESGMWSSVPGPAAGEYLRWMQGAALVFGVAGCLGVLRKPSPLLWGGLGGGAAFLFIFAAWARADMQLSSTSWVLVAAAVAVALLAIAMSRKSEREPGTAGDLASGLLSAGAALLLLFSADRMFDQVWLTLAAAILALAFAILASVMKVTLQASIAAAFGTLVTIRLFVSRHLWSDDRNLPWGQHWLLYGYGIPVILFLIASRLLKASGYVRSAISLEGLSLGLVISLVSLEIRVLIGGGVTGSEPGLLEISAHILTWLGAAYGLLYRQQLYSSFIATWGARFLLALSGLAILGLSLLALNPVISGAALQGGSVVNTLLLAYLAPAVLIGLIMRRLDRTSLRAIAGAMSLLLVFAYVTLETKRVFQGATMVPWSLSSAESYAYSAVWLLLALALFLAGLRLNRQHVRYAGLGIMVLVVVKVFLLDMSNLEGLYRIASFVGLGLCLVGIGWLYQRFVQRPSPVSQEAKGRN